MPKKPRKKPRTLETSKTQFEARHEFVECYAPRCHNIISTVLGRPKGKTGRYYCVFHVEAE